jgi:hypothetical protein
VSPYQTVVDSTGTPVPGALLYFYASGTNTPLTTYSDALLTVPNPNPVKANAAGVFPNIFMAGNYKVVLTDSLGNQLWTADPVYGVNVLQNPLIIGGNAMTFPGVAAAIAPLASPSFTTPALDVATGTSLALGGCTIGTNAFCVTGTIAIPSGSLPTTAIAGTSTYVAYFNSSGYMGTDNHFTFNNGTDTLSAPNIAAPTSFVLAGGTSYTAAGGGGTLASVSAADQTLSGGANLTPYNPTAGNVTIDCGKNPALWIANTGAWTITAPAADGECILQIENGAGAAIPTWSGFSEGSATGDALTTTSGNKFQVSITRIHSISHYLITALQ